MSIAKVVTLIFSISIATSAWAAGRGELTPRPLGTTESAQGYLEYLPPSYGAGQPSPLIVFLSGRGQGGAGDLKALDNLGNLSLLEEIKNKHYPADRPFVVLSPQHPTTKTCPDADEVDRFIQYAKATYNVDPNRIYLAGVSCGARGVANYLAKYRNKDVAAAMPIAGDLSPAWDAQKCDLARDVALFGVHGALDTAVKIGPDAEAFRNLSNCPQRRDVEYVVYEDAGHIEPIEWMFATTADYDLFSWMLRFKKTPAKVAAAATSYETPVENGAAR